MRIAYDLRYASDHFPGIGTHAYCLLESLLAAPGDERYDVIWNPALRTSRFDLEAFRRHPRARWTERSAAPVGLTAPWKIGREVRALAPDLYFSPFSMLPVSPGCPVVLTLHDVLPLARPGDFSWLRRTLFRASVGRASGASLVFTSSEFSRGEIARLAGLDAARVRVVRPGVPGTLGAGDAKPPANRPAGAFALVVGINKPHKNLTTLIDAWARLGPTPGLELALAGPEDPRYGGGEALARVAGAHGVRALGRVSDPELAWLYRHATLVLFPTLYEGFGFPLVEAMACGAPAIVSDIPVLHEVGEGVTRFVAARDAEAWAEAIRTLFADAGARERMRAAGLARARELDYARTAAEALAAMRGIAGRA